MVGHRHRLLVRVLLVPKKLVTEQEEVDEPRCVFFDERRIRDDGNDDGSPSEIMQLVKHPTHLLSTQREATWCMQSSRDSCLYSSRPYSPWFLWSLLYGAMFWPGQCGLFHPHDLPLGGPQPQKLLNLILNLTRSS